MTQFQPYYSKDYVIQGSYIALTSTEIAWNSIDGRMRTAIRKAQKSTAMIKKIDPKTTDMSAFISICLNADDLPEVFTDEYTVYFAYNNNILIAGIIVKTIDTKLFMLCHASTKEAKNLEVPSLLIWHIVEEFAERSKYTYFDVGASYRYSLQTYFSGWKTDSYPIIMNPPELKPDIRITPFDTAALGLQTSEHYTEVVQAHLRTKWNNRPYTFVPRAMYGISTLSAYVKQNTTIINPSIWITTTTDTEYISSCVTSAIEKSMPWTRSFTENTAAIFCIHEFGFKHPKLEELRTIATNAGIPLIEDCAYAWGDSQLGTTGDYAIYSLTKAFPVQFGGFIVGLEINDYDLWHVYGCSDKGKQEYTYKYLANLVSTTEESITIRRYNYEWYTHAFGSHNTYFTLTETTFPGAFVLRMPNETIMKQTSGFVQRFGIECGNYWKNSAIFIPVHQCLQTAHLEYIAGSIFATKREWCGVPLPDSLKI